MENDSDLRYRKWFPVVTSFPASGRNSMVECQLPKLKVASSILVARSKIFEKILMGSARRLSDGDWNPQAG
jgi:hypothetical protein